MKYVVNVDRGVERDPLTGRVMDLRGQSGAPFVHVGCGAIVEVPENKDAIASAELLVKRGFLLPIVEKRTEERFKIEK